MRDNPAEAHLDPTLRDLIREDVGDIEHELLHWVLGMGFDGREFHSYLFYRALTVEGVEQSGTIRLVLLGEPQWKIGVG